jgi:small subunit ribosomal protein S17
MSSEAQATRKTHKKIEGVVTSNKMDKTITVRVERLVKHPLYGKYIKKHAAYKAHDKDNRAKEGDKVVIVETRPLSKTKRWSLLQILGESQ